MTYHTGPIFLYGNKDKTPALHHAGLPLGLSWLRIRLQCRDLGLIPGLGRSPGEGKGNPLQCSGLENAKDCIVHGLAKSWTRLSDFHFHLSMSCRDSFED